MELETIFKVFAEHIICQDMSDGRDGISEDKFLAKFADDAEAAKKFFDKHADDEHTMKPFLTYGFCCSNSHPYEENPYSEHTPIGEEDLAKIRALCEEAGI